MVIDQMVKLIVEFFITVFIWLAKKVFHNICLRVRNFIVPRTCKLSSNFTNAILDFRSFDLFFFFQMTFLLDYINRQSIKILFHWTIFKSQYYCEN